MLIVKGVSELGKNKIEDSNQSKLKNNNFGLVQKPKQTNENQILYV
jgi:hypothetical protein